MSKGSEVTLVIYRLHYYSSEEVPSPHLYTNTFTGNNNIFGLSSRCFTIIGLCMCNEVSITASTSGGADAVTATNGALHRARKPPSFEKDCRKSVPLSNYMIICIKQM